MPDKQDVLRYVLTANAPETKDNDFTWRDFQVRNNSELVAIYGNFINRTLVLTGKYFDGKVPPLGTLEDIDSDVLAQIADSKAKIEQLLDNFHFRDALREAMNLARTGNKYLADTEPWKLAKTDMSRVATILNVALQLSANLNIAFEPFLPFSSAKLRQMLQFDSVRWADFGKTELLPAGHALGKTELLFEQIDDAAIYQQINKLQQTKAANDAQSQTVKAVKETVEFDDFLKLDIRIGTVVECSKVPKADKLLQFRIDDGMGGRTIVSGIAAHYPEPEKLVGTQVCFVANFAARKLRGIDSEGMILSAEMPDGSLVLVQPNTKISDGSTIV